MTTTSSSSNAHLRSKRPPERRHEVEGSGTPGAADLALEPVELGRLERPVGQADGLSVEVVLIPAVPWRAVVDGATPRAS